MVDGFAELNEYFLFGNRLDVPIESCVLPVVGEILLLEDLFGVIDLKTLLSWSCRFERSHEQACDKCENGQTDAEDFEAFFMFMSFFDDPAYDLFVESIGEFGRILVDESPSIGSRWLKTFKDFASISLDLFKDVKVRHWWLIGKR